MEVAYGRTSDKLQNEARQVEAFKKEGITEMYIDKQSGKDFNREQYQIMKSKLAKATSISKDVRQRVWERDKI